MKEPVVFSTVLDFTLDFQIVYITKEFTVYQMVWHYIWVAITLVFMFVPKIGFFYEMTQLHQNFWSRQQVGTPDDASRTNIHVWGIVGYVGVPSLPPRA